MTGSPWQREHVIDLLRARLLVPGAVTDGFTGLDVLPGVPGEPEEDDRVVVLFRWRLDPAVYAVGFDVGPDEEAGPPVDTLEGWVAQVWLWLMEELGTGLVRRAARRQVGDVVVLVGGLGAVDVLPEGHHLGDLYLGAGGSAGAHLARQGLDTTIAQRLLRQDRLLVWMHAYVDNARAEPVVGHVVLSRGAPAGSARLETLEVVPGTPPAVAAALAFHAVRSAVELGAGTVVSDLDDPALDQVGFRADGGGGSRSVDWRGVRTPDVRSA